MNILSLVDMYVFCKMKSFTRCNFVNIYRENLYEIMFIPINCHLAINLMLQQKFITRNISQSV